MCETRKLQRFGEVPAREEPGGGATSRQEGDPNENSKQNNKQQVQKSVLFEKGCQSWWRHLWTAGERSCEMELQFYLNRIFSVTLGRSCDLTAVPEEFLRTAEENDADFPPILIRCGVHGPWTLRVATWPIRGGSGGGARPFHVCSFSDLDLVLPTFARTTSTAFRCGLVVNTVGRAWFPRPLRVSK